MSENRNKIKVLFLCTGNSCRSQIAEGWAKHLKGDIMDVYSAGIAPGVLNQIAVKVMAEAGVDISAQRPKHIDELKDIDFDYVVTVCDNARENCPIFPSKTKHLHKTFEDPTFMIGSEQQIETAFVKLRDQMKKFVEKMPKILEKESAEQNGSTSLTIPSGVEGMKPQQSELRQGLRLDELEKYTSAITLSDMEIFVFPELMYSLVLADIMSPIIWQWRELDCFKKLEGKSSYKKLMRLRQFIMDEYDFNLDLETWGLTSKAKELKRFAGFLLPDDIAKSNALFGYHGDSYYFDVDIRKHFGLDKYDSDIIPYWKTETIEAMNAFRLKEGYKTAAGECVSLAGLYVAAAFIVCGIPLEDIYMILTPLHSQNFIDIQDGFLTNNRRLITKTMWFNGTAISNKAQRALRNENVTIVAHPSGYVHCLYKQATIDKQLYQDFTQKLSSYLSTELTLEVFTSFLRCHEEYQKFFQLCRDCHGQPNFLRAEVLFHYEHASDYKIACKTHDKLLAEVSDEDFAPYELPSRIRCDKLEEFLQKQKPDLRNPQDKMAFRKFIETVVPDAEQFIDQLADFVHVEAKLPSLDKIFVPSEPIKISVEQNRGQIVDYLQAIRKTNPTADLAFYAYRDMESCDWVPFVKAAVERNPVSIRTVDSMSVEQVHAWLEQMENASIYDGKRLAQPDEVANYKTGDGLERAFLLANVIRQRNPAQNIEIVSDKNGVILKGPDQYRFLSAKDLKKQVCISADGVITILG